MSALYPMPTLPRRLHPAPWPEPELKLPPPEPELPPKLKLEQELELETKLPLEPKRRPPVSQAPTPAASLLCQPALYARPGLPG